MGVVVDDCEYYNVGVEYWYNCLSYGFFLYRIFLDVVLGFILVLVCSLFWYG